MSRLHAAAGFDLQPRAAMISSAQRALTVLETIGSAGEPIGVTDIARRLGLRPGTVFRSLDALEQAGYIARFQSSSRYLLGPTINQLRQTLLARFKLREVGVPYLRQLAFASGETVALIMRVGWYSLRLAAAAGTNDVVSSAPIGQLHTLEQTCGGHAILAFLPGNEFDAFREWARRADASGVAPKLLVELQAAKRRGFAIEAMSFARDRASVAFPIYGDAGPIAAIAIEGPVLRLGEPGDHSEIEQWMSIVRTLQSVVDIAPRDFAGPFAQQDASSIALRSTYCPGARSEPQRLGAEFPLPHTPRT
jgi:IclR family transcriptional regulator, acetate operon repressor